MARDGVLLRVAELDGRVAGWIHAQPQVLLTAEPFAEIVGLVVDRSVRRAGVGRALVAEVVRWARASGLPRVRVRSNVVRPDSHAFYGALGFTREKTQHCYELPVR